MGERCRLAIGRDLWLGLAAISILVMLSCGSMGETVDKPFTLKVDGVTDPASPPTLGAPLSVKERYVRIDLTVTALSAATWNSLNLIVEDVHGTTLNWETFGAGASEWFASRRWAAGESHVVTIYARCSLETSPTQVAIGADRDPQRTIAAL